MSCQACTIGKTPSGSPASLYLQSPCFHSQKRTPPGRCRKSSQACKIGRIPSAYPASLQSRCYRIRMRTPFCRCRTSFPVCRTPCSSCRGPSSFRSSGWFRIRPHCGMSSRRSSAQSLRKRSSRKRSVPASSSSPSSPSSRRCRSTCKCCLGPGTPPSSPWDTQAFRQWCCRLNPGRARAGQRRYQVPPAVSPWPPPPSLFPSPRKRLWNRKSIVENIVNIFSKKVLPNLLSPACLVAQQHVTALVVLFLPAPIEAGISCVSALARSAELRRRRVQVSAAEGGDGGDRARLEAGGAEDVVVAAAAVSLPDAGAC